MRVGHASAFQQHCSTREHNIQNSNGPIIEKDTVIHAFQTYMKLRALHFACERKKSEKLK
jgi:hypothetical protein